VTSALQLTPPISTYGDIGRQPQVGIMLYTRAAYTSQTDPVTGWRRAIYLHATNEAKARTEIADNFTEIKKTKEGLYLFIYKDKKTGKIWSLSSQVDRFVARRNNVGKWEHIAFDVTKTLDIIFQHFNENQSIREQLQNTPLEKVADDKERLAWQSLVFCINMLMQIRNGNGKKDENSDFLHSPVINES